MKRFGWLLAFLEFPEQKSLQTLIVHTMNKKILVMFHDLNHCLLSFKEEEKFKYVTVRLKRSLFF